MNNTVSNAIVEDIKRLYEENSAVAALLDILATKKKKRDVISVKYASQLTGLDYDEMEEGMKALHEINAGKFTRKHGDSYARLTWLYHPKSLADAAAGTGRPQELDVSDDEPDDLGDEGMAATPQAGDERHEYLLRPGRRIVIDLPLDMTQREAERLAQFIQSLAFEASY